MIKEHLLLKSTVQGTNIHHYSFISGEPYPFGYGRRTSNTDIILM